MAKRRPGGEKLGEAFPGFRPAQPMVYAGIFPEARQGLWVSQCMDSSEEGFWDLQCLGGRVEVILHYIGFDEQSDLEAAWLLNAKCVVSPWDRLGCLVFAMKLGLYTGTWISSDVFSPQSNAYSILCVVCWRSMFLWLT